MQRNVNPPQVSIRSHTMPEFLTTKDLEAILKIDAKTIYAYVQRGLIPYGKIQSNVRFSEREIIKWIERQSYRPHQARKNSRLILYGKRRIRPFSASAIEVFAFQSLILVTALSRSVSDKSGAIFSGRD